MLYQKLCVEYDNRTYQRHNDTMYSFLEITPKFSRKDFYHTFIYNMYENNFNQNYWIRFSFNFIGVWIDTYVFYQSVLQKKDLNLVIVCRKDVMS